MCARPPPPNPRCGGFTTRWTLIPRREGCENTPPETAHDANVVPLGARGRRNILKERRLFGRVVKMGQVTRGFACGDQLLERGPSARQKSFTGFGQANAARRSDEECRADARLKRAYRLADRRWRYPEFRRRPAKTAVPGDAQEGLHAIECALPDCEVL